MCRSMPFVSWPSGQVTAILRMALAKAVPRLVAEDIEVEHVEHLEERRAYGSLGSRP
jgi:hypothetical protein